MAFSISTLNGVLSKAEFGLRHGCGYRYCIRSYVRLSTATCSGFMNGGTTPVRMLSIAKVFKLLCRPMTKM